MHSRASRLTIGVLAWIVVGSAAAFVFASNRAVGARRSDAAAFEHRAVETANALADARAAEQAYVAQGQGVAFWIPKVDTLVASSAEAIDALHQRATSKDARNALVDAATSLSDFTAIDKRAREYVHAGQPLMASDIVFMEGGEALTTARRYVDAARLAERQTFDLAEAAARRQQATAGGVGGGGALLALALLALVSPGSTRGRRHATTGSQREERAGEAASTTATRHASRTDAGAVPAPAAIEALTGGAPDRNQAPTSDGLDDAAALCAELSRLTSVDGLNELLPRVAHLMGSTGVIVWAGSVEGADLRPVAAHGYPAKALARMPRISRDGDNAVAAVYRTGTTQVVPPAGASRAGAIVSPLLTMGGCIGALTAELVDGGHTSARAHALAAIFAAPCAAVLRAGTVAGVPEPVAERRGA